MEITLTDGRPFLLVFPVFVPMLPVHGGLIAEPVNYSQLQCAPVYSDSDLADRGMESQGHWELELFAVPDAQLFCALVGAFRKNGATHLAIDVCTAHGRAGGHIVPIEAALN